MEGIAAAESANNAVTGATLIPLLTLGIPGDGVVAIMLSALMINGLNPGLSLFTTDGDIMYAIMLGLILVNIFMLIQGKVPHQPVCKGRLHSSADPDPHHCDFLLCRCIQRQQQLFRSQRCPGLRSDGLDYAQAGAACSACAAGYGSWQHD